ncbi:hypothetical protein STEG23_016829, partial [Scotinomys teguina]
SKMTTVLHNEQVESCKHDVLLNDIKIYFNKTVTVKYSVLDFPSDPVFQPYLNKGHGMTYSLLELHQAGIGALSSGAPQKAETLVEAEKWGISETCGSLTL